MTALSDLVARPYSDADLPHLMETVSSWITAAGRCGYDHIGELPHRIYENLRGKQPVGDLVWIWESSGDIVGGTIALRFGNAFDAFAAPSLRGTNAERHMIESAYTATANHPNRDASDGDWVLTDVFDCDTTRIDLLERLGFTRFRVWDHANDRDLTEALDHTAPPDGFVVRSALLSDAEELARAHNSAFDDTWTGDLYRREVMNKPGYEPDREFVAVTPEGRVAAFAVTWLDARNRTGHFEPVGTHQEFRRLGLAGAVMQHAMRDMRERGLTLATVNHNAENLPAAKLYASLGFTRRHETYGYPSSDPPIIGAAVMQRHPIADRILDLLQRDEMWHEAFDHEPVRASEEATALRPEYELRQGAKALIVRTKLLGAGRTYAMLVMPADRRFDGTKAKQLLGTKEIRFATEPEVEEVTGGVKSHPRGAPSVLDM